MEKAQVLIVEDEKTIAKFVEIHLKNMGYGVTGIADTGELALEKIKERLPDIVLMDIMLKGDMDGIETAKIVRDQFGAPVIYLSACNDNETLERAKITEPFGYLNKPFEDRELQIVIEIALYKRKMEKEQQKLIKDLRQALDDINTLHGLLPICSGCKKIRNEKGYWKQLEDYLHKRSGSKFTHGLCPDCKTELYPEIFKDRP